VYNSITIGLAIVRIAVMNKFHLFLSSTTGCHFLQQNTRISTMMSDFPSDANLNCVAALATMSWNMKEEDQVS
jgi:hypothetical protein